MFLLLSILGVEDGNVYYSPSVHAFGEKRRVMCHMNKSEMEGVCNGEAAMSRIRVEFIMDGLRRRECFQFFGNEHSVEVDEESLQKRADAFYENIQKLMDAYAFQLRRAFGKKANLLFAWKSKST